VKKRRFSKGYGHSMKQKGNNITNKIIICIYILSVTIRFCIFIFQRFFFIWPPEPWDQLIIGSFEPYLDYKLYYQKFTEEFLGGRWLPYVSDVSDPILASYVYPPLFLYTISVPALINTELTFIPLFLADFFYQF
jgi:hypothetical protein